MNQDNKLTFEQKMEWRKHTLRHVLAILYLPFLLLWFLFVLWVVIEFDLGAYEGLGLGTATGIFLGSFKDMWQFIWRKK